ncbi:hypothetical protein RND71_026648 [Anisodus tanguticus]|uniref:Btz domain-containing protein n=1 Tax=Anisodus tanguticus TaxID=243964 RepID=A0AAE1RNN8_9SOLA|nr:hypothetical protein RND71_026648 [Anisodus tanguticus]
MGTSNNELFQIEDRWLRSRQSRYSGIGEVLGMLECKVLLCSFANDDGKWRRGIREQSGGNEAVVEDEEEKTEMPLRSSIDSDNESEGQGAPAVYEEEVEYEEELYEEGVKEVVELVDDGNEHNLEKKENEPYAVSKAGAFYMHDDRFGDNVGGPHKIRGADSGASRGRRPKAYINGNDQTKDNKQKIQNNPSKAIRGRGPRRYRLSFKDNIDTPPPLNNESGLSVDKPSLNSTNKASAPVSDLEKDALMAAKQRFMSRLNYDSPPFYPSSSSSKETTITQTEMQTETSSHSTASSQSTAIFRKNLNDSLGINKLNIDDFIPAVAGKPSSSFQLPLGLSSSINSTHSQALRGQGRGCNASPHRNYQSPASQQVTGQQLEQQSGTGSQVSSLPKTAQPMNTCEPGELEFSSESIKSTSCMVAKGKGSLQGAGRGYGTQTVGAPGNMGSGHSNQNFSGTPTFLPVISSPSCNLEASIPVALEFLLLAWLSLDMLVNQMGFAIPKNDMVRLPVLAGAAGALGAPYCSPYIAADGAYHPRPSEQISSLGAAPIKENNASKPNSELKPQLMPEACGAAAVPSGPSFPPNVDL